MLVEQFLKWLFGKKSPCEHEWVETKVTYNTSLFLESNFKHHLKCKKCGKKIKRLPRNVPENTLKNDVYYIS